MKVRKSLRSLKKKPGAQVIRRHGKVFAIPSAPSGYPEWGGFFMGELWHKG